jgi:uncharacterized protein YbjT (DUF2867 family)
MTEGSSARRVLLVGGGGGLLGRSLLPEISDRFEVRSVHRHPTALEATAGVQWIPADAARLRDWGPLLEDVDVVVNVAWYRYGNTSRFRHLYEGLHSLLEACRAVRIDRFVQLSVPAAPPTLEQHLPYLVYKRRFDRELLESGLSVRVVRPTMMFAPGDRLLTVMLRLMRRYARFPMFGDGAYHLSPIATEDVARIVLREALGSETGIVDAGGPVRYRYHELTDRMFQAVGRPARYLRLGPRGSVALAQLFQDLGSEMIYAYEVAWLLSDLLGPAPYRGLEPPMHRVEPFLDREGRRLGGPGLPPLPVGAGPPG